jgi:hypothetical protein
MMINCKEIIRASIFQHIMTFQRPFSTTEEISTNKLGRQAEVMKPASGIMVEIIF